MASEKPIAERIQALHAWYQANVLPQRLTPEVERLWFGFFKQGYNGQQLARVIRYLRRQISFGKRNEGALLLRNLLGPDENGSLTTFDEALALASSRSNLQVEKRLAPLPEGEAPVATAPAPAEPLAPTEPVPGPITGPGRVVSSEEFSAELRRLKAEIR